VKRRAAVCTLAALVAAGVALHAHQRAAESAVVGSANGAREKRSAAVEHGSRQRAAPIVAGTTIAASLRGTRIDGAVRVDADGQLVRDVALRRYLDYFLSASGERDDAALRAAMLDASRLDANGRAQLAAFIERYVAYAHDASAIDIGDPERGLRERRRRHFGDRDAATLFADLDTAADAMARRRDDPAQIEPALQPSDAWHRLDADEARRSALTPAARLAERTAELGPAAAARLAALDAAEHTWNEQVAALRTQLGELRGAEREAAIDAALAHGYTDAQRRRLRALLAR
jgi:lipase chaperone LimK